MKQIIKIVKIYKNGFAQVENLTKCIKFVKIYLKVFVQVQKGWIWKNCPKPVFSPKSGWRPVLDSDRRELPEPAAPSETRQGSRPGSSQETTGNGQGPKNQEIREQSWQVRFPIKVLVWDFVVSRIWASLM